LQNNFPRELQRLFEQHIVNNRFPKGAIFSLRELAKRFRVDEDSMYRVLQVEYRKGLVAKKPDGHFEILELAPPRDSVFSHTKKLGFNPTSEVREVVIVPADSTVAERLALDVGDRVYRFVRTRYVNGEALANQTNFIPFEICPGLENDDVTNYSFQKLLEKKYLTFVERFDERFSMELATDEDQKILNLPTGAKILYVDRISLSTTGCPLVWSNIRIRPDRYQYVSKLWPSAAKLLETEGYSRLTQPATAHNE